MTTKSSIVYGLACERSAARDNALRAVIAAGQAHRFAAAVLADGSGWDAALTATTRATQIALDECANLAAKVFPQGEIGGELILAAMRGHVPGLDSKGPQ